MGGMLQLAGSVFGLNTESALKVKTDLCYGRMVKRNHCYKCMEICPTGAISIAKKLSFNEDKCTGCGACTIVCPSENRILKKQYPQLVEHVLQLSKTTHEIAFTCNSEQKSSIQVPCLSYVGFEIMLLAVSQGITKVTLSGCSSCKPKNLHQIITNLGLAKKMLREASTDLDIIFMSTILKDSAISVSRRDFFSYLSKQMRSSVGDVGESNTVSRDKVLNFVRAKLDKKLNIGEEKYLIDKTKCGNCTLCIKLCPHQAWERNQAQNLKFNREKCWECGNCLSVCPRENIKS